jgi:16S rRNA C967 or C1407 C5-methylase (RsmB/RsmF family)
LTENFVRKPLATQHLVEACTQLYKFYGSIKSVSEETGLPQHKVREYVKYDRVIPALKKLVDDRKIEWPIALKAQDAATSPSGDVDESKALKFAETLKTMTGTHRKALEKIAEAEPDKSAEEVIEAARKPPQQETLRVTLLQPTVTSLQKLAEDDKVTREEAAADLIISGLRDKGY